MSARPTRLSPWDTEPTERMVAEKILIGGALMGRKDIIRQLPSIDFAAPEHQQLAAAIVEAWQQHGELWQHDIPERWLIYLSAYVAKHTGEGLLRDGAMSAHCLSCAKWYGHWERHEDWQAGIGPNWNHPAERLREAVAP